jgi:signal transduction histidine kinase
MQPAESAPRNAETAEPRSAELIQHLAHELRQPLSGIESAAYYLDMVVSEARPDLIPHCRRLRAMVQHANWLLDDAMLCALFRPAEMKAQALPEILDCLSRRMLEEEEAVLDLHAQSSGWVVAPEALPRLIEHLVAFFRDVAGCHDPIHAGVQGGQGWMAVRVWADGCEDAADAARTLRAASECGFLGRFLAAAGGVFEVEADESARRLLLTLRLRAAEQGE